MTHTLAASLAEKHIDGFFLDNTDVYYIYHRDGIYKGLISILSGLSTFGLPIIINGGDTFVRAVMEDNGNTAGFISGVNQECVFTSIDFENNTFSLQNAENHEFYTEYIELCKQHGFKVYLTEYAEDPNAILQTVSDYCAENSFLYYISPGIELDGMTYHN